MARWRYRLLRQLPRSSPELVDTDGFDRKPGRNFPATSPAQSMTGSGGGGSGMMVMTNLEVFFRKD
jgi:hypothetical protein